MRTLNVICATAVLALSAGCSDDAPANIYQSVRIESEDMGETGAVIPKGEPREVTLKLKYYGSGKEVTGSQKGVEWLVDDPQLVQVRRYGDYVTVVGLADLFDTGQDGSPGFDPMTTITAVVEDLDTKLSTTLPVRIVANLTGSWLLEDGDKKTVLAFWQLGDTLYDVGHDSTSGKVLQDTVWLDLPYDYERIGKLSPDRKTIVGLGWTATRQ